MEQVIETALRTNKCDISFVSVIAYLINCVEMYSVSVNTGKGSSKFAIFRECVPVFLRKAVELGLTTQAHADGIWVEFERDWGIVADIVSHLIAVAHNPTFVQLSESAKQCCMTWRSKGGK